MKKLLALLLCAPAFAANPVTELNNVLDIDIADYPCDVTIAQAAANWNDANDTDYEVVCIAAGDHSAKGRLTLTDPGVGLGTSRSISAITLNNPVRVDFTAAHGWSTGDIIHCNDAVGGTWPMRWRYFKVSVVDTDTVDLLDQDGTGTGVRPAWPAWTSGGTCAEVNFKVFRHAVDITEHPALLASGSRAKIRDFDIGTNAVGTDFLMFIGLSFDHKGLTPTIPNTGNLCKGCDYIIVDNSHFYNDEVASSGDVTADYVRHYFTMDDTTDDSSTQYVQIQRNMFNAHGGDGLGSDSNVWALLAPTNNAIIITANEMNAGMGGGQTAGSSSQVTSGFLFSGNSDYITTMQYSDCNGNFVGGTTFGADSSSPCALAESAGAFKTSRHTNARLNVTNANRHLLNVYDANVQCCRREEDGVFSDGGSGGQSWGLSSLGVAVTMRDIMWRNNVVFANEHGIPEGFNYGNGSVIQNTSTIGNINYDITHGTAVVVAWFQGGGDTVSLHEFVFNTMVDSPHWMNVRRVASTQFECNLLIDVGDRQNAAEATFTQQNNYGYGDTVEMDGTGDSHGGAVANADMTDLVVNPKPISDPDFEYTLPGVLSTVTSPHIGDCPGVGTIGRGVSDAVVTF